MKILLKINAEIILVKQLYNRVFSEEKIGVNEVWLIKELNKIVIFSYNAFFSELCVM